MLSEFRFQRNGLSNDSFNDPSSSKFSSQRLDITTILHIPVRRAVGC